MSKGVRMMLFIVFLLTLPVPYLNHGPYQSVLTVFAMFLALVSRVAPGGLWGGITTAMQVVAFSFVFFCSAHLLAARLGRLAGEVRKNVLLGLVVAACGAIAFLPVYTEGGAVEPGSAYRLIAYMTLLFVLSVGGRM